MKPANAPADITLLPLLSPADLVAGPKFETTPKPVIRPRRVRSGRLRVALLASGLPVLTMTTAALVCVALARP